MMLAFDHRRSLLPLFGVNGAPGPNDAVRIADAKLTVLAGLLEARPAVDPMGEPALLVDEQFGGEVLAEAARAGVSAAIACERSGQSEFEFEYGERFGQHLARFAPRFVKALVRFNPDGDPRVNERQVGRLQRLAAWVRRSEPELLFELLVPPTAAQLAALGGDRDRYDSEQRPDLVRRAVVELRAAGIEPSVWKIEGLAERRDCERVAAVCRENGGESVGCLILGRGADERRVEEWLRIAAPVEGFTGFAVGRTIWWDAIGAYLDGDLERDAAIAAIAERYQRFARVYREAQTS